MRRHQVIRKGERRKQPLGPLVAMWYSAPLSQFGRVVQQEHMLGYAVCQLVSRPVRWVPVLVLEASLTLAFG